jgi:hypothetical protein
MLSIVYAIPLSTLFSAFFLRFMYVSSILKSVPVVNLFLDVFQILSHPFSTFFSIFPCPVTTTATLFFHNQCHSLLSSPPNALSSPNVVYMRIKSPFYASLSSNIRSQNALAILPTSSRDEYPIWSHFAYLV